MKKQTLFSIIFLALFFVSTVYAGYRPPFGGEYTNLCGSGTNANFYNCPAQCDINNGSCTSRSNEWIYVFVCNGRTTNCDVGMRGKFGPGSSASVISYTSVNSGKTVQIDVFNKECDQNGGWSCNDSNLRGYLVWYSGDPQIPPPPSGSLNLSLLPISGRPGTQYTASLYGVCGGGCETNIFIRPSLGSCGNGRLISRCPNWRWDFTCTAPAVIGQVTVTGGSDCGTKTEVFNVIAVPPIVITLPVVGTL